MICAISSCFCFVFRDLSGRGRAAPVAAAEATLVIYCCRAPPSGQSGVVMEALDIAGIKCWLL